MWGFKAQRKGTLNALDGFEVVLLGGSGGLSK